jgi:hypothetical protein
LAKTSTPAHPASFLEIRVHRVDLEPGLSALCAGFEDGKWRADQLAEHVMKWLPEFALRYHEWNGLGAENAVEMIVRAARSIYKSQRFKRRGEFGEILLHIALRQCFQTVPAISKYFYKDSRNDTVKGFDAVHVVCTASSLELWLGEVKFYDDISRAISDVVKELEAHTQRDYLRDEFAAITNKIDDSWPHAQRLRKLIDVNTSLDEVFDAACVPVLLTYDSAAVAAASRVNQQYKDALEVEVLKNYTAFTSKKLPAKVKIHLFLLPLKQKQTLAKVLHERLQRWQ